MMSEQRGIGIASGWLCRAALVTAVLFGALAPARATDGKDKPSAEGVFEPGKVWKVDITLPAKEYAAMQPPGGWGFGGAGPAPKPGAKPEAPARQVHRNPFGVGLPWAKGSVTLGGETFPDVGIR